MLNLQSQLSQLNRANLLRRRRVVEGPQEAYLSVAGKNYLSFCNNDYLGLANHPEVIAAAKDGLEAYGLGAGASALISGHSRAHEELELRLAEFVRMPRALYFSTGYMANLGIIPALIGTEDVVFCDRLNHACLIDAARLSRAEVRVYPHLDMKALEQLLGHCSQRRKLVATDAVFSMDGDIAPLPELVTLCERYDATLLIDDAHGFGVLGQQGRGSLSHFHISSKRIIYMGTLGKAAGVCGAFVAAEADLIEWLVQRARTYVFTTANPPMLAMALLASLKIIERDNWRRERIQKLIKQLREGLLGLPWNLLESHSAIQALIVGENDMAMKLMEALHTQGIWVPAIRPPSVPKGTARLRISLSALHTEAHIEQLIKALHKIATHRTHGTYG